MDTSRSPSSLYYRPSGVTPKKSPSTENVQKRRRDIVKSEKAAYWALFNTSVATLLYYDIYYLQVLRSVSVLEWIFCGLFTLSAIYGYMIHFWPHTFMKPLKVSPVEKKLLGIREDEFGFEVEESKPVAPVIHNNLPQFEVLYSFEDGDPEPCLREAIKSSTSNNSNATNASRIEEQGDLSCSYGRWSARASPEQANRSLSSVKSLGRF